MLGENQVSHAIKSYLKRIRYFVLSDVGFALQSVAQMDPFAMLLSEEPEWIDRARAVIFRGHTRLFLTINTLGATGFSISL